MLLPIQDKDCVFHTLTPFLNVREKRKLAGWVTD